MIPLINHNQAVAWARRWGLADVWVCYLSTRERLRRSFHDQHGTLLLPCWGRPSHRLPYARVISWMAPAYTPRGWCIRWSPRFLPNYSWCVSLQDDNGVVWSEYAPRLCLLTPDEFARERANFQLNQISEFLGE